MKKVLNIFSICAALLAALALWGSYRPMASSASAAPPLTFDGFPPEQPRTIDFSVAEEPEAEGETRNEAGAALSPRDHCDRQRKQFDQMRDWLLLTLVSSTGLPARELNQCLYDLPARRSDSLRQISNFEYGETRSRIIRDNQVIALVPVAGAAARADHLAHIADEQRKSLGEIPGQVFIFEYELHLEENYARITRLKTVPGQDLFTSQYGYLERLVRDLKEFEQFMSQIDDLTFARQTKQGLILGGRKLQTWLAAGTSDSSQCAPVGAGKDSQAERTPNPLRGVNTEHVAAIWRSERGLTGFRSSGFSLDPWIDLPVFTKEFDVLSAARHIGGKVVTFDDNGKLKEQVSQLTREKLIRWGNFFAVTGSVERAKLREALEQIETEKKKAAPKDQERIELISQAVFLVGMSQLCQQGTTEQKKQCGEVINDLLWDYRFQTATYFGDLRGTGVGMSLFYTDLLMKLWGMDYLESAPRRIPDFPIKAQMKVSAIYQKEVDELPATRFWFAPLDQGFQVAEGGETLLFARNATKIFVRPHDFMTLSDRPDAVEPNVLERNFINWWNDHFEEIARYEPEYERLNEIMKWSQLVGWLNAEQQMDQLKFLEPVPINRTYRFDRWVKQHPELTFKNWEKIKFYEPSEKGTTTEALETLSSKTFPFFNQHLYWRGGVSLAGRATFAERAALSKNIVTAARRANLDYRLSDLTLGRLRTLEATEYRFSNFAHEAAETLARARPNARLRGPFSELANVEFQRTITCTTDGLLMRTRAAGADFGDLSISRTARGYQVGWQSRDLDLGQTLARRLSTSRAPEALLARDPQLESVIKLSDESWLVKARGADRWIKFSPGEVNGSAMETKPLSQVAEYGENAKVINVTWVDDAAVQNEMQGRAYLVISGDGSEQGTQMTLKSIDLPASFREVQVSGGNTSFKAVVDRRTGEIYVNWKELPASVRGNPRLITQYMRAGRIELPANPRLARTLEARSYSEAARDLARDPAAFRKGLDQRLADELKRNNELLRQQQFQLAQRQIEDLVQLHGQLPELKMRQALVELSAGKVERAAGSLQETLPVSFRERQLFLDEINQRLANQAISAQERANLVNLARYTDWREARLKGLVEGDMNPIAHENKLRLRLEIKELPQGKAVSLDELAGDSAVVYVQDSAALSHLDAPPATLLGSLRRLSSAKTVTVRELELTDLTHFRPAMIYETHSQTTLRLSTRSNIPLNSYYPYYPINPCRPDLLDCKKEEEKEKRQRVYLVVEK